MERISAHISYKEATDSNTAKRRGNDNTPNKDQLVNMERLANMVFEPLREKVGEPIKINSFFRSPDTNEAVGGSRTSAHCATNDQAAIDIDDDYCSWTNAEMFHWIKDNLEFDQLIAEYPENGKPAWIHIGYRKTGNRKQVLIAIRKNGRTSYVPYEGEL